MIWDDKPIIGRAVANSATVGDLMGKAGGYYRDLYTPSYGTSKPFCDQFYFARAGLTCSSDMP